MRTIFRSASAALAAMAVAAGALPDVSAYYSPFSRYFDESPDFVIDQAFQYANSDTFYVRVCNKGDTPVSGGALRIAVGRTPSDKEERYYSNIAPAAGTCSNFELSNVRQYGRRENRNYALLATVSWSGGAPESALTNNSKNIPANPTLRSTGTVGESYSWTPNSANRTRYSDPVSDLYLDRPNNPYPGRTWYYSGGGSYVCGGYWDGGAWRPYSQYSTNYSSDSSYGTSYSYYSNSNCYDRYVPGTSGYYWNGSFPGGTSYSDGSTYYNGPSYYDPTANRYYTQDLSNSPNFFVARLGRDGSSRNVLATVCNNGADMSSFKDLTVTLRDLSKNTSFRSSQYVRLLSGQCRDVSINFSSFGIDYSGYHTFEATADSDNKFAERDENDNVLKADVFVQK